MRAHICAPVCTIVLVLDDSLHHQPIVCTPACVHSHMAVCVSKKEWNVFHGCQRICQGHGQMCRWLLHTLLDPQTERMATDLDVLSMVVVGLDVLMTDTP